MKTPNEVRILVDNARTNKVANLVLEEWFNEISEHYSYVAYQKGYDAGKPKWITVEERLPESYKGVVLWIDVIADTYMCESVTCGSYQNDHWTTDRDGGIDIQEITVRKWLELNNEIL